MKSIFNKVVYFFKRHPLLYLLRYILLSKNNKVKDIDNLGCFQNKNTLNEVPELFFEINKKIKVNPAFDEFDNAIIIGKYLRNVTNVGPGIGLSSEKTLGLMLAGKGGVCSDFAQFLMFFALLMA